MSFICVLHYLSIYLAFLCIFLWLSVHFFQYSAVMWCGLNEGKGQLLLSSKPLSGFMTMLWQRGNMWEEEGLILPSALPSCPITTHLSMLTYTISHTSTHAVSHCLFLPFSFLSFTHKRFCLINAGTCWQPSADLKRTFLFPLSLSALFLIKLFNVFFLTHIERRCSYL